MSFKPQYDTDVFIIGPTGSQHLNPKLYATPLSAHQLADELATLRPMVVMAWPIKVAPDSHFIPNKRVPFLRFPGGYQESAGSIQVWWDRVPEPEGAGAALRYCMAQITVDRAEWEREQEAAQEAAQA